MCLCRVHAKLGDYASALEAAAPLNVFTGDGIYVRLPKCHVSLQVPMQSVHACIDEM